MKDHRQREGEGRWGFAYRHGDPLSLWRGIRVELLICHGDGSVVMGGGGRVSVRARVVAFRVSKVGHGRESSAITSSVGRAVETDWRHHGFFFFYFSLPLPLLTEGLF